MMIRNFLVEIRIKDWLKDLEKGGRTFTYIEVTLEINTKLPDDDERHAWTSAAVRARYAAMDEVRRRALYEPAFKRELALERLSVENLCAPDAVELD